MCVCVLYLCVCYICVHGVCLAVCISCRYNKSGGKNPNNRKNLLLLASLVVVAARVDRSTALSLSLSPSLFSALCLTLRALLELGLPASLSVCPSAVVERV